MRAAFVESFPIEAVKDEPLPDKVIGFPADHDLVRLMMSNVPVVMVDPYDDGADTLPFDNPELIEPEGLEGLRLKQVTGYHVRSFEVDFPGLGEPWQDEHGNTYTSLNLKGNNFSDPGVLEHVTAADRYIAFGLQESSVMRRVLRASRLMRENGIGTEYILGMAEPKDFPWPLVDPNTEYSERISLPEYKHRIVEKHWQSMPDTERTAEALVDLASKFERMTFYVTLRAMDCSERLGDLASSRAAQERVFAYINEHIEFGRNEPLTPGNSLEMNRYLDGYFAPTVAKNLAKLHDIGLAHRYPYNLNITALGSLVDSDSVHGKPLGIGDEPITAKDITNDMQQVLWAIDEACYGHQLFSRGDDRDPRKTFLRHYFQTLREMGGVEQIGTFAQTLGEIMGAYQELAQEGNTAANRSLFRSEPGSINIMLEEIVLEFLDESQKDQIASFVLDWIENDLGVARSKLTEQLNGQVPLYISILLEEYINELVDVNYDFVGAFFKRYHSGEESIFQVMWDDMGTLVDATFSQFVKDNPERLSGPEKLPHTLYAIYFAQVLMRQRENPDLWGKLSDIVEAAMPGLEEEFIKRSELKWPKRIFPDQKSYPIIRSTPNVLVVETPNVPLKKVAEFLETSDEELIIERMGKDESIYENNYTVTEDGSILVEFVSDTLTEGLIQDVEDDEICRGIRYEIPHGQYLLFVEQKPDGTRRLRIDLKDISLADRLAKADRAEIIAAFRQEVAYSQHLFDPSPYRKNPLLYRGKD